MNRSVSSDGAIIFWTAAQISRQVAHDAFDAEGCAHLLPKPDLMASMYQTARQVVDAVGVHANGVQLRYFPLATEKQGSVGVEIRQVVKGKSRNDYPFLFSLGVTAEEDGTDQRVEVLDCDSRACPDVAAHRRNVEMAATAVWSQAVQQVTANDLTNAIVALVKRQHGVLMRSSGGVYYVTEDKLGPYIRVSDALGKQGVALSWAQFSPTLNDKLLEQVAKAVNDAVSEGAMDIIQETADLTARSAKPRSNGQRTRLQKLVELEAMADHMKQSLGEPFVNACKLLQQAREAIGAEGINMMRNAG